MFVIHLLEEMKNYEDKVKGYSSNEAKDKYKKNTVTNYPPLLRRGLFYIYPLQ